jgi:hypothetical protein
MKCVVILLVTITLVISQPVRPAYVTDCSRKTTPWVVGQVGYVVCNQGTCETSQIGQLSRQVYNNIACNSATSWSSIAGVAGIDTTGSGISQFPFLQKGARDSLVACVNANRASVGADMVINSAIRVSSQQHLLYQWGNRNKCVGLVAVPGTSNHEAGLSVDVNNYQAWSAFLQAYSFAPIGSSDPVHFDYTGPPNINPATAKSNDIKSFQALWNLNNPTNKISVTGVYDAATGLRFDMSPVAGFTNTNCAPF